MRTTERLCPIEGLDYCGQCRCARLVPGGYFDFAIQSPTRLLLSLAAAYGKEIPAAVLMTGLQASLRSLNRKRPKEIGPVMGELNRMVCHLPLDEFHVSMFCAEIDSSARTLHYVNAGHAAPLVIRHGTSRVLHLANSGTVLGLTARTRFEQRTLPFDSGDVLVAVSEMDSVSEDLLIEVVRRHPWDSSGELTRRLMRIIPPGDRGERTVVVVRAVEAMADALVAHADDQMLLAQAV